MPDFAVEPVVLNNVLYFLADDGQHGLELWRSDGTERGTYMVKDINPSSGRWGPKGGPVPGPYPARGESRRHADGQYVMSEARAMLAFRDMLIFLADDGEHGVEVWRSDGTEEGTFLLRDIRPGPESSINLGGSFYRFPSFTPLEARGLFIANDGVTGFELWATDGTSEGTYMVKNINRTYVDSGLSTGPCREASSLVSDPECYWREHGEEAMLNGYGPLPVEDGVAYFFCERRCPRRLPVA